jgi:putative spermidine/putrescine transport system ATP-binding protein
LCRPAGGHKGRPYISAAMTVAPHLEVVATTKRFGAATVLDRLDLAVGRGEFVSLLGPSGCGKTTLLRLIAGLLAADGGSIRLGGRELTRLPAHKRNVGVVFQNYALFPHLTVAENVAFGLKARGFARSEIPATVARCLAMVRLDDFAGRSIFALSGGQQQRVAVARALAVKPDLLLLDEPFSALDRKLRETMQIELRRLLRELGITAVFVTHDQDEALVMSDRIAVMNAGIIEQFAAPAAIYAEPATPFVLEFVGLSTRLKGRVAGTAGDFVTVETAAGTVRARGRFRTGSPVLVAVRPEKLALGDATDADDNGLTLRLADAVYMGSKVMLHLAAPDGEQAIAELNPASVAGFAVGDTVPMRWRVGDTLLYPAQA